jgi:transposase InsO family protein
METNCRYVLCDIILDATGRTATDGEIQRLWNILPSSIKAISDEWGFYDTEFRNKVYEFILDLKRRTI